MSTRKPHNNLAGYVCELKSKHPKLPGHIAIFRTHEAELDCGDCRWAVAHMPSDGNIGCFVGINSLQSARELMKDMAAGGNMADLGQHNPTF